MGNSEWYSPLVILALIQGVWKGFDWFAAVTEKEANFFLDTVEHC